MIELLIKKYSKKQFDYMIKIIEEEIDFEELVSKYTETKNSGKWLLAKCPFHSTNTTDAVRVSNNPGDNKSPIYWCNNPTCIVRKEYDGHLSIYEFWKLINKLDTNEEAILDIFLNLLNYEPLDVDLTEEEIIVLEKEERKKKLYNDVSTILHNYLINDIGKIGRDYIMDERKITMDYLKKYNVGFSPGKNYLKNALLKKGYKEEELIEFKILNEKGYDVFWGRIVFPVYEGKQIVNFYSRILDVFLKDDSSKKFKHRYFNNVFPLYNLQNSLNKKNLILVEGIVDCISTQILLDSNEYFKDFGVIATYGTNGLTKKHLEKLYNYDCIYLAADNDENFAGQTANIKLGKTLQEMFPETNIRIVKWPTKDVNDLLRSDIQNKEESFINSIENAISLEEFIILTEIEKIEKNNSMELIRTQFETINKIDNILNNLDFSKTSPIKLYKTLQIVSNKIGVPIEFILLNLISYERQKQVESLSNEFKLDKNLILLNEYLQIKK